MLKQMIRPISISARLKLQGAGDFLSTNAAKQIIRLLKKNSLHISNHDGYFDGAGAQTQRILSIYCLANFLQSNFLLKPIEKIELQPIDFIETESALNQEITNLNVWLSDLLVQGRLPSDFRIGRVDKPIYLPWKLLQAAFFCRFFNKVTRLSILDGYFACRARPEIWDFIPSPLKQEPNVLTFQIHIHLRLTNFLSRNDRSVELDFYKDLLKHIDLKFKNSSQGYSVVIHTDILGQIIDRDLLLKHAVPESLKFWRELKIIDSNAVVYSKTINEATDLLQKLIKEVPNCELYNPHSWISEWESMASAHLLILGKSSYSAVGGLLNNSGLVVGPKFWSSGRENWCTSDDLNYIKDWISKRL
jgi:hypothetical protein